MPADGGLALHDVQVLYEALREITSTLDLGERVRAALDAIKRAADPEGLSLLLHDADRSELVFAASETLCEETLVGNTPAGLLDEGTRDDHRLLVELRRDGDRLGTLALRERDDARPFDAADRRRLEAVAADLAASLDVGAIAHDSHALQAVFARVVASVPARTAVLAARDAEGHELVFTSSRVLRPGVIDGVRLRLDQGIAGWVASHRQSVCLDDADADPRHDRTLAHKTGLVARSMLCVPLVHRDALLGVVQVINKRGGGRFVPEDMQLVEALGAQAAIAIAQAQLYRRVEVASLTDDLTGLGNTRRFNAALPTLLARGGVVSLIVLDLDELKGIVDTHGHLVGSRTIATVGRLIAERVRAGDVAVRFGGDEFVVVMPDTPTAVAMQVAETIRAAVAACSAPDGMAIDITQLTASLGVSTYPSDAADADGLFRAADQAMYRVKFGGKNGVGAFRTA
jgi:diguanylate cyclase (GGDEF)-like protein